MGVTPFPGGAQPAEREQAPHLQRLGVAATDELRVVVRISLTKLLEGFLQKLPAALQARSQASASGQERQACDELVRILAAGAPRWMHAFIQGVDANLIGGIAPRQPSDNGAETVESFAMVEMELDAEEQYKTLVTELDVSLDQVRKSVYIPIFAKALAPAGLCRVFQDTADAMHLSGVPRRILFEKFDDFFISQLRPFYVSLIEAIKRIGTATRKAAQVAATGAAPAARAPAPVAAPAAPTVAPAAPAAMAPLPTPPLARRLPDAAPRRLEVDEKTLSMLQQFAANDGGTGYSDATLATELLSFAADRKLPDLPHDPRWAPLQRLTMAGDFLSEAIADPFVPDELRQRHESVRFPLVKSALADESFFTAVTHPLRSLVNDLMLKSATSRVTGSEDASRIADLLQQVLTQFDLAPDFVREAMKAARPIVAGQIAKFREMERQQAEKRRTIIIQHAKRRVIRELELCTFGRPLPPAAIDFLNKRWGPMLVKRLLQRGVDHDDWKAGVRLMERMLDLLEARVPDQPAPPEWEQILREMAGVLAAEGMAGQPVSGALNHLYAAWTAR